MDISTKDHYGHFRFSLLNIQDYYNEFCSHYNDF